MANLMNYSVIETIQTDLYSYSSLLNILTSRYALMHVVYLRLMKINNPCCGYLLSSLVSFEQIRHYLYLFQLNLSDTESLISAQ